MTALKDARQHSRRSVSGTAMLRVIGETGTQKVRIVNLSAGGALLEAARVSLGTRVQLRISGTLGRQLDIKAVVVRNDEPRVGSPQTVAVRFQEISRAAVLIFKNP